jgi:hypothetical protein
MQSSVEFYLAIGSLILSPSALLITIASAISIIPRLMPCNSSPAPDILTTEKNQPYCEQLVSLAYANSFYNNDIKTCSFTKCNGFTSFTGYAS